MIPELFVPYINMQRQWYKEHATTAEDVDKYIVGNVDAHNSVPYEDYLSPLLRPGTTVLEYGCGIGRMVDRISKAGVITEGVDISPEVINHARVRYPQYTFYVNDGYSLSDLPSNKYDGAFSVNCMQHISVHDVRQSIFEEIYRVLKDDGIFVVQFGFGAGGGNKCAYYSNSTNVTSTNGYADVEILVLDVVGIDLQKAGFKNITYRFVPKIAGDGGHEQWVYLTAHK